VNFYSKKNFYYILSMKNNNKLFSYNNKLYKTGADMKKAKPMDAKRAIKQAKKKLMQFLRKHSKHNKAFIFQNILKYRFNI
jgi:hypothetical protein